MFHLCSEQALPLTNYQIICTNYRSLTMCVYCIIPQHPLRNAQEEALIQNDRTREREREIQNLNA